MSKETRPIIPAKTAIRAFMDAGYKSTASALSEIIDNFLEIIGNYRKLSLTSGNDHLPNINIWGIIISPNAFTWENVRKIIINVWGMIIYQKHSHGKTTGNDH